ncbi:MAG: preprotein translocase subunit SecE [Chloroflexota bacterium]|nr:preprotein translocase subunit SecE [Chloroflexota bacterium]
MASHSRKTRDIKLATKKAKKPKFRFLSDAIGELKKAHWPTRQEALRLSLLVLAVCIIVGAILGGLDFGFTKLFTNVFLGG